MKTLPFYKLQGCGNSYLFFDLRKRGGEGLDFSKIARNLSDRAFGVGADGAVFLLSDRSCACRMKMYNADGTEGKICGNALRCIGRLLCPPGGGISVRTSAGVRPVWETSGRYSVGMGRPLLYARTEVSLFGQSCPCFWLSLGNPHAVVFAPRSESDFAEELIGQNAAFSSVNISLVSELRPGVLRVHFFERGSGSTLSCGSGACACAAAGFYRRGRWVDTAVLTDGGTLPVSRCGGELVLSGDTRLICAGRCAIP